MLPFLVDLESAYIADTKREYDPEDLVAFALSWPGSDYWPALALDWLEQGAPRGALGAKLRIFGAEPRRSRELRLRARRLQLDAPPEAS